MPDYKLPHIYVEEKVHIPPTNHGAVQSVPLFIAGTSIARDENPVRLKSLADFEAKFQTSHAATFPSQKFPGQKELRIKKNKVNDYSLRDYFALYFANGGGMCWLFSCGEGDPENTPQKQHYLDALAGLPAAKEFDLLMLADAVKLSATDYAEVVNAAIGRANELGVFFIGDVYRPDAAQTIPQTITAFRNTINTATVKNAAFYHPWLVVNGMSGTEVHVPPSAAIAGVYVNTDKNGIWKGSAAIPVKSVLRATQVVTEEISYLMNIDPARGFSVNSLRNFEGKGLTVWGIRTLAGNDNEWRYVPVRRLFLWVERSIRESGQWVVFEPNDANTWVKLTGSIENFLIALWRQGALRGGKPEQAFYVNVGLGETMTSLDILEGRLIVEIGMASVRPAEFIILRICFDVNQS